MRNALKKADKEKAFAFMLRVRLPGLDEVPSVYKNIDAVMAAQTNWTKSSASSTRSS